MNLQTWNSAKCLTITSLINHGIVVNAWIFQKIVLKRVPERVSGKKKKKVEKNRCFLLLEWFRRDGAGCKICIIWRHGNVEIVHNFLQKLQTEILERKWVYSANCKIHINQRNWGDVHAQMPRWFTIRPKFPLGRQSERK